MIQVHILLGGVLGPDGAVDSAGLEQLGVMLGKSPGVVCHTYFWEDWQVAAATILKQPALDKTVVIGYSGGGSRATWLANATFLPHIDVMVLYDPSPSWQMKPVGKNVVKALCFHNTNPMMFVPGIGELGGGILVAPQTELTTIDIAEQHLLVQSDQRLHAQTVAAVLALASP